MRAVAEEQPGWLLVQVAPEDRSEQPAGDDIVRAVALKVKALRPGPLVGGKGLRQGLYLRRRHVEKHAPDVHLVATEHKGLRRRAPRGKGRRHDRGAPVPMPLSRWVTGALSCRLQRPGNTVRMARPRCSITFARSFPRSAPCGPD